MQQFIEFIGNHYLLSSAWVALAVLLVYSFVTSSFSPVKELSTHEATMLMNKEDAVVVDIRSQNEFKKGHILGAKQIPAEKMNQGDFSSLENSKDKPIILVCAMGMSAKKPAMDMLKKGFTRVNVLKGGMNAWSSANLPLAK
ncbi:rhodanese-like domain-containing protein [Aliiglaciecola sp. CAU 1673]|uniref:rhodanese-like domain-containing protein n=1 Tax=Aliiglaciecola sp. CAU 1673 TaxID=3032595 RepID=UPI0023DC5636|nr:rhodanese-like domain-containing protein [Aliiglaciecola sp. CAU 1673]MDF2178702.1 rhodanese-like domain-containing protein [Aliiglaciecola sp. CAU 1673]